MSCFAIRMPSKPETNLLLLPHLFHSNFFFFPPVELTLIFFKIIFDHRFQSNRFIYNYYYYYIFPLSMHFFFSFFSTFGCLLRPYSIFLRKKKNRKNKKRFIVLMWFHFLQYCRKKISLKGEMPLSVYEWKQHSIFCVTRYFSSISNVCI